MSIKTKERYDSHWFVCLTHPVRNCSHTCICVYMYHPFLDVLIRFHASDSIRYDAQIFVAVRTLSSRFVPVRQYAHVNVEWFSFMCEEAIRMLIFTTKPIIHHNNISVYCRPLTPHFYIVKVGLTGVYFFLNLSPKHSLNVYPQSNYIVCLNANIYKLLLFFI